MRLNKIEGLKVQQGVLGRLLGYGVLDVSGTGGTKERFTYLDQPMVFRQQLQKAMERAVPLPSSGSPDHDALPAPPRTERACPYCAEPILAAARVCKHCHKDLSG